MKRNRLLGLLILLFAMCINSQTPKILLTEVYGGGGNSGAIFNQDYVELFNPGTEVVPLAGWSIQYYTSTGTSPSKTIEFAENSLIMPLQHFLIGASGGDVGANLPGKDLEAVAAFSLSSGKIVLFKALTKKNIVGVDELLADSDFVDYIPYGRSAIPMYGSSMEKDCSSVLSASRKKDEFGNYIFTSNVGLDFETILPNPVYSGLKTAVVSPSEFEIKVQGSSLRIELSKSKLCELFNLNGQLVFNSTLAAGSTELNLPWGVYLCRIDNEMMKLIIFEH